MVAGSIRIREFPADGRRWRVDWLGAVERGKTEANEPHIQVALSPIDEEYLSEPDNKLSSNLAVDSSQTKLITIHCGQLPITPIGSIWRDGYLKSEIAGEQHTFFNLQISPDKVKLIRAGDTVNGQPLIPPLYYRYSSLDSDSWVVAIESGGDPYKIIIPALELLRFYFATSSRITRHLFAGDIIHNRNALYNDDKSGFDESQSLLHLQLRQGFTRDDGWAIGRIIMSKVAFEGAARLHDDLLKSQVNREAAYPRGYFPFVGVTNLRVRKKPIKSLDKSTDKPWRSLVLSIENCSAPFPFDRLAVTLDNNNDKADAETDIDDKEKKERKGNKNGERKPKGITLQNQLPPNADIACQEVPVSSDRFSAIKDKEIERLNKEACEYKSSKIKLPSPPVGGESSTEGGTYNGSDIGQSNLNTTRQREESLGVCFNAFTAAIEELNSREGYTARLREAGNTVRFMPLTNATACYQWSYLDSATKQRRMVITADIEHKGCWYTLVDFELRKNDKCRVGLIRKTSEGYLLTMELETLLKRLAPKKGVWQNADLTGLDIEIEKLKHTWPNEEKFTDAVVRKILTFTEDGIPADKNLTG